MPSTTKKAVLLDANVLIALTNSDHEHHEVARRWLGQRRTFATCPSTQGSLARYLVRVASAELASRVLSAVCSNPRHEFWGEDLPFDSEALLGVVGHRQVTDAYLARLCRNRQSRLATFDFGLSLLRPNDIELIGK